MFSSRINQLYMTGVFILVQLIFPDSVVNVKEARRKVYSYTHRLLTKKDTHFVCVFFLCICPFIKFELIDWFSHFSILEKCPVSESLRSKNDTVFCFHYFFLAL